MRVLFILIFTIWMAGCTRNHYQPTAQDKAENAVRRKAALELRKNYDLRLFGTGGGSSGGKVRMLALSFHYYKEVTIDEGRELLVAAVDELVSEIYTN